MAFATVAREQLRGWSEATAGLCYGFNVKLNVFLQTSKIHGIVLKYIDVVDSLYYYCIGSAKIMTGNILKVGENILSTTGTV